MLSEGFQDELGFFGPTHQRDRTERMSVPYRRFPVRVIPVDPVHCRVDHARRQNCPGPYLNADFTDWGGRKDVQQLRMSP